MVYFYGILEPWEEFMARSPFGCCGTQCSACEIYIASTSVDDKRKSALAAKLSKVRGKRLSPDDVHCWGCWSNNRNCWGKRCYFRKCAADKGIDYCYKCRDFPCSELSRYYQTHSQSQENLIQISKMGFEAYNSKLMSRGSEEE
jgi:hypothetical protein